VRAHIDRSVSTIKADAAARTYATSGDGIVWAVIDSGIDQTHPHFACGTLTDPAVSRLHRDFTGLLTPGGAVTSDPASALTDPLGHGTHVAGIIAGAAPADPAKILITVNEPSSTDLPSWASRTLEPGRTLSGIAPRARLVSLKVLDATGNMVTSAVIAALAVKLAAPGTAYHLQPGAFYLLDANAVISANQSAFSGAHSDIQHAPVIWPLLSAAH
jgi:subtilisin family serine protease